MKKKLLIGGGLVALVAVIVAIAVLGKGGGFLKGRIGGEIIPDVEVFDTVKDTNKTIPSVVVFDTVKLNTPVIPKLPELAPQVCGDGVIQGSEECDDKNKIMNDFCTNCKIAVCGDGIVNKSVAGSKIATLEVCDDGNRVVGDTCSPNCDEITTPIIFEQAKPLYTAVCGNGVVEIGETCDDFNIKNGDGCSSTCTKEIVVQKPTVDLTPTITLPSTTKVECGEWKDTTRKEADYDISVSLCENGIVTGDDSGNLRLDDKLNRAELLTLAFRASDDENVYTVNSNAKNCFPDVKTQWYAPAVCTGKTKGFIQGYPDGKMKPENRVTLAEGLKMFLGALDEPFDTSDKKCWYCDIVNEAGDNDYLPYSFDDPEQVGSIELTRGKAFNMLYRIREYR